MIIRVVLDTNVVVSAVISTDGNPALIFEMLILEDLKNYTTQEIIEEIKEVLQRPRIIKRISLVEQDFIVSTFEKISEKIVSGVKIEEIKDDPDDNKFLECAVSASADYIISGDKHLLKLHEFRGIKIVSPAEFVKLVTGAK